MNRKDTPALQDKPTEEQVDRQERAQSVEAKDPFEGAGGNPPLDPATGQLAWPGIE
ncbi:hypothetical protein IG197_27715 [Aminobacter sp. SR38]|jgi:hypothetical protein|uniref:hypothetical protein n=1 Tax=Aminobacter sp. SR38 TaxID=2774562 RepID=UPI00178457C7|nr:hypothetical protein [Aminobacter sp. SR38]QOF71482.1 hypothetical protein IG197_27715 [Aminobacter sp. SR38]